MMDWSASLVTWGCMIGPRWEWNYLDSLVQQDHPRYMRGQPWLIIVTVVGVILDPILHKWPSTWMLTRSLIKQCDIIFQKWVDARYFTWQVWRMLVDKLVDNWISADMMNSRESQDHDGLIRVIGNLRMYDWTKVGVKLSRFPCSTGSPPVYAWTTLANHCDCGGGYIGSYLA